MKIIEYPKIETLFNRDPKTFKVIEGEFRFKEFEMIKSWEVTEKVDGTNIRVIYNSAWKDKERVDFARRYLEFMGRTARAQIPAHLEEYLKETFTVEDFDNIFDELDIHEGVILFGEGYGEKIQKGGRYRKGVSFRLFDVWVSDSDHPMGGWWLEQGNIKDVANRLGINYVPSLGIMSTEAIVKLVKQTKLKIKMNIPRSIVASTEKGDDVTLEGLVARSNPLLFTRRGKRLMWKLKVRDFKRD